MVYVLCVVVRGKELITYFGNAHLLKLWSFTQLGINFDGVLCFKEWFVEWLRGGPSDRILCEFVCSLWEIWCAHNRAHFDLAVPLCHNCLANIEYNFSMLMKTRGIAAGDRSARRVGKGQILEYSHSLQVENGQVVKMVVNGAWHKESLKGVSAWCVDEAALG